MRTNIQVKLSNTRVNLEDYFFVRLDEKVIRNILLDDYFIVALIFTLVVGICFRLSYQLSV